LPDELVASVAARLQMEGGVLDTDREVLGRARELIKHLRGVPIQEQESLTTTGR
jgi:hypothetical protein